MKAKSEIKNRLCGQFQNHLAVRAGVLLLLALPAVVQAQFTYVTNNGTITITRYTGSDSVVFIPSTINGLPVTSIGDGAFNWCFSLTSITIPDSVTSIGFAAFSGDPLTSITIGNGVTSITSVMFAGCHSLVSITMGNGVTNIGDYAFYNFTKLTSVV